MNGSPFYGTVPDLRGLKLNRYMDAPHAPAPRARDVGRYAALVATADSIGRGDERG